MAYRLKVLLNDNSVIDTVYQKEEYATNLYAMALFKGLAKSAEIIDTVDNETLFKFESNK